MKKNRHLPHDLVSIKDTYMDYVMKSLTN